MRTLAAFMFAAFCACTGEVQYRATGTATIDTPDLVEVSPGVQVVADYDEPVFYSDGAYWRFYGDTWYRSDNYAGGWVYAERPPERVVTIRSPGAFVHYRPSGYVARHREYRRAEPIRAERRERRADPVVRDHREERHEEHREEHREGGPVVRDHRDEHDKHDKDHDHDHH